MVHELTRSEEKRGRLRVKGSHEGSAMKWRMQFYNERRGILARYEIEAPSPTEAVQLGWKAVRREYPLTRRRSRLSLFERAERIGGQDPSGWVLYRIANDDAHESHDPA